MHGPSLVVYRFNQLAKEHRYIGQLLGPLEGHLLQIGPVDLPWGPAVKPYTVRVVHIAHQFCIIFPAAGGPVGGGACDLFHGGVKISCCKDSQKRLPLEKVVADIF